VDVAPGSLFFGQVVVTSTPAMAFLDGSGPAALEIGDQFDITLHRKAAPSGAGGLTGFTIDTAELQLASVTPGGMAPLGSGALQTSGGAAIRVGDQVAGATVAGFGNSECVCVNGALVDGPAGTTTSPVTAAPTSTACVSRISAPCGMGCCRGLFCTGDAVLRGSVYAGTCQLLTGSPTGATNVINDGKDTDSTHDEITTTMTGNQSPKSTGMLVVGVILVLVAIGVAVGAVRKYLRSKEMEHIYCDSETNSEAALHFARCTEYASVDGGDTDRESAVSSVRESCESLPAVAMPRVDRHSARYMGTKRRSTGAKQSQHAASSLDGAGTQKHVPADKTVSDI
jgi:hypothetical protein